MPSAAATLAPPCTLIDAALPARAARSLATDAVLIVGASLLVAASARVAIPLPWTPVPVTGQTFAVLLTGMLLGWRRGALALALYLLEGAAGLPVFAGGAGGAARLIGPTGGYLWSYPLAAALVGWLAERGWDRRPHGAAFAMGIGSAFILLSGGLWLSVFVGDVAAGFGKGLLSFLPVEMVKVALAAALLPGGWAVVRWVRGPGI
jgi:biotin transport system substrate-specific component